MDHYITKEKDCQALTNWKYTSVTIQNDRIIDVVKTSYTPRCHIKKITKDLFMKGNYDSNGNFWSNGEVFKTATKEEPMRNRRSLKKIFRDLRQLISNNFVGGEKELFVTMTYAEQTNDHERVYADFKAFWKRLKRAYASAGLGYITVVEPHESGNFHIHMLLRATEVNNLYIPNEVIQKIWGNGYTKTERLEDVDHMGAYVIAYMSNMEIPPEYEEEYAKYNDIVERDGKKYIKGKRLDFYPDGMQIHRHSRDIVKPDKLTGADAERELAILEMFGAKATYSNVKEIEQKDIVGNDRTAYMLTEQYKSKLPWE